MLVHIRRSAILIATALVLTFAFAFLGTGVSQLLFKHQADGSITANGSTLIGQNWSQTPCPGHRSGTCVFQGRPWKYFGLAKFCPISSEPITLPFSTIRLPFA